MRTAALLLCALLVSGCEQDMADAPRHDPLEASGLFPDGASARTPVTGTVARDADLSPVPDRIPFAITPDLLRRGQERFDVFCAPCHGSTGEGDGMIVQRGFPAPPSFHQPALRSAPDRHFHNVITDGYGVMYPYASRVPPDDRWAIVAYIRALQYSRHAPVDNLPQRLRDRLGPAGGAS
ncbi:MAG: quinol:cytochrome C oxidoreductase [Phyllobacteriaceae bacterium]|mgnify:CR=1 FL=1|nr:quinol:cytochrome C oxidoreductase [Phyllobacteriaceae bacterium]MBA91723.1 quinol:cytochrome C oxidoreductase [Phyllobacteriaceae bacterium]